VVGGRRGRDQWSLELSSRPAQTLRCHGSANFAGRPGGAKLEGQRAGQRSGQRVGRLGTVGQEDFDCFDYSIGG
jgi:hypothetical protein